jgi:hypothetical protein
VLLVRGMTRTLLALAVLAGICAFAFRIANADDKPPQEMSAADTQKWVTFFDKLVDTVVKASACDKMAGDVNKLVATNQDAIDTAKAAHAAGRKLPQTAQQHMMEGVKRMVPGLKKCGQDDRVRAAFAKLDLTRKDTAQARRK